MAIDGKGFVAVLDRAIRRFNEVALTTIKAIVLD